MAEQPATGPSEQISVRIPTELLLALAQQYPEKQRSKAIVECLRVQLEDPERLDDLERRIEKLEEVANL